MKKKIVGLFLFLLSITLLLPISTSANSFTDLDGHWAKQEILEAVDLGIIQGYGNGKIGPRDHVTREQFAAFLVRALNLSQGDIDISFTDVDEDRFLYNEIYIAASNGLINGYEDGTFKPTNKITRLAMAIMIDRALEHRGIPGRGSSIDFVDKDLINPDFHEAVGNSQYYGIINGKPGNIFAPLDNATRAEGATVILRMLHAKEIEEEEPTDEEEEEEQPISENPYAIASVNSDGELVIASEYSTFEEANNAKNGTNNIILKDNKIIVMDYGIVRPTHRANSLRYIYEKPNLTDVKTYVSSDLAFASELNYLSSTEDYIQVSYAGETGYVNPAYFELVPTEMAKENRNYYSVSENGNLVHSLYNANTGGRTSYEYGPAPLFLIAGEIYYSFDGINFTTTSGAPVGKAHQYFNYLPIKSKTNYTAEELNNYIINNLPSGNGFETSVLIGLGEAFIEAQEQYGVNALYLLGKAIHESGWGTSKLAREKNNLFGLNASDENPFGNGDQFNSLKDCILHTASEVMRNGYASYNDWRFHGAVSGNKGAGFNVRYASDMYWGQKIAGHMNRIDRYLGRKDLGVYEIGKTNYGNLNVRTGPSTANPVQFQYENAGAFVIIYEKVDSDRPGDTYQWYKVSSDHKDHEIGYIREDYIEIIIDFVK